MIDYVIGQRNRVVTHAGDEIVQNRMPPQFGAGVQVRRGGWREAHYVCHRRRVGQHFRQGLTGIKGRQRTAIEMRLVEEH